MTLSSRSVFRASAAAAGTTPLVAMEQLGELTADWRRQCLEVLGGLSEPLGVVLAKQGDEPVRALVVEPGGRAFEIADGQQTPKALSELGARELLMLVAAPLTARALSAVQQSMAHAQDDEKMGQGMYAKTCAELLAASGLLDYDKQFEIIEAMDQDASVRGGLVGRCIKQPAADGHAHYMVTAIRGDRARVQHLDVCDGYAVSQWGRDAWIDKSFVTACLRREAGLGRFFSSKP